MAQRLQVNPTRMELTRLKRKLATATRGHKLLKDKRDELMRQFLERVRENRRLRLQVEAGIRRANEQFMLARASMQDAALNTALLVPKQQIRLECAVENVMSVEVPTFTFHTRTPQESDMFPYGFAFTSGDLDDAIRSLNQVFPAMLQLAESEKSCQLLAEELERTRRRVNALEHIVIPETRQAIRVIRMKLEENERSALVRLVRAKQ